MQLRGKPKEGEILNKWFKNRMIKRNQNILVAVTGGTGSGKSYVCHRIAELWYKQQFKKQYPVKTNTCFSIGELVRLLNSGDLKKGELIIFEEAGANFSALEFQQRVSKLFTFVLQSFRSMNIGILFNLPVLTMLNKSARLLLHAQFITAGIDYGKKTSSLKPLFRQLNQQTGKIYHKYLKVTIGRTKRKIQRFNYELPDQEIIKVYEHRKMAFVTELTQDFVVELDKIDIENRRKVGRKDMTTTQFEVYNAILKGFTIDEIAEERGISKRGVYVCLQRIEDKGYAWKKKDLSLGKHTKGVQNLLPVAY